MEKDPKPSIADLNDAFRKRGNFMATPGILGLPDPEGLFQAIIDYDDFTPDNDPYGEHDFGALEWDSERVLWKIDYFDLSMQYGAEDPSDEENDSVH